MNFTIPPASDSPVLEIQVCTTTAGLKTNKLPFAITSLAILKSIFMVLGTETWVLPMSNQCSITELYDQPKFDLWLIQRKLTKDFFLLDVDWRNGSAVKKKSKVWFQVCNSSSMVTMLSSEFQGLLYICGTLTCSEAHIHKQCKYIEKRFESQAQWHMPLS